MVAANNSTPFCRNGELKFADARWRSLGCMSERLVLVLVSSG
jgi:hypothetical protein